MLADQRRPGHVRALVLRTAGTNCATETAAACAAAGAQVDIWHLGRLAARPGALLNYHLLVLPGGFAHGDYLGAGTLAAAEIEAWVGAELREFVARGRLVLGICNGFQILSRLGLLPEVALAPNAGGRFECRWTHLQVNEETSCLFTRGLRHLDLPVAHGEGRVVLGLSTNLAALSRGGHVVLRYADAQSNVAAGYPWNPNGSEGNVAGVCNATGTVFGLMPHPERATSTYQQPGWTRGGATGSGQHIFVNAVRYLRETGSLDQCLTA